VLRPDPLWIPIIAIVSMFIIAPWMAFRHEERKRELKARESMAGEDSEFFHRALTRLEQRVKTLESILDREAPGWRGRHGLGEE
jgi:phage shock protein B